MDSERLEKKKKGQNPIGDEPQPTREQREQMEKTFQDTLSLAYKRHYGLDASCPCEKVDGGGVGGCDGVGCDGDDGEMPYLERRHVYSGVETHFDPDAPFFTPEKARVFISNPSFLDNMDTYLTMQLLVMMSDELEKVTAPFSSPLHTTMFVGSLCGNYDALEKVLERFHTISGQKGLVFLGGYMGTDGDSLKILNRLFLEKIILGGKMALLASGEEKARVTPTSNLYENISRCFLPQDRGKVFNWYAEIFDMFPEKLILGDGTLALSEGSCLPDEHYCDTYMDVDIDKVHTVIFSGELSGENGLNNSGSRVMKIPSLPLCSINGEHGSNAQEHGSIALMDGDGVVEIISLSAD